MAFQQGPAQQLVNVQWGTPILVVTLDHFCDAPRGTPSPDDPYGPVQPGGVLTCPLHEHSKNIYGADMTDPADVPVVNPMSAEMVARIKEWGGHQPLADTRTENWSSVLFYNINKVLLPPKAPDPIDLIYTTTRIDKNGKPSGDLTIYFIWLLSYSDPNNYKPVHPLPTIDNAFTPYQELYQDMAYYGPYYALQGGDFSSLSEAAAAASIYRINDPYGDYEAFSLTLPHHSTPNPDTHQSINMTVALYSGTNFELSSNNEKLWKAEPIDKLEKTISVSGSSEIGMVTYDLKVHLYKDNKGKVQFDLSTAVHPD